MHTTEPAPKSARHPSASTSSRDYKLVVVGHRAVGKSALVVRFLTNRFISEYQENSEMTCSGVVEIDGEKMQLKIQDTSEKGIRLPTVDHHFRAADAIMLVYSITDRMGYQRLRHAATRLKEKVMEQETMDDKIPTMVVVGNKGDLDHMRQVEIREGLKLAEELGCEFYETSASEGWSIFYDVGAKKQHNNNNNNNNKPRRRNGVHEIQRPSNLWGDKSQNGRRKSDPSIALNTIFGLKVPAMKSPENDMNNNGDRKNTLTVPVPTVPQISISPSAEAPAAERTQSRGRKLMQKLSPRFSRKFGGSKQPNQVKSNNIGAGIAKMSATAGLAVGNVVRDRCNTLPVRKSPERPGSRSPLFSTLQSKQSPQRKMHTLKADGSWNSTLSDSSASSSSTESLVANNDTKDGRPTFFLRPETPVSEAGVSTSSEDESPAVSGICKVTNGNGGSIRRSRSISRNLCLEGQKNDRLCNSDSDSSKRRLSPGGSHKRGHSETRLESRDRSISNISICPVNNVPNVHKKDILFERKYNASEPFKHLCREARSARRMRDKMSPSRFFRDGIRKIKTSFGSDQAHQNNIHSHFKNPHFHVTAVGQ